MPPSPPRIFVLSLLLGYVIYFPGIPSSIRRAALRVFGGVCRVSWPRREEKSESPLLRPPVSIYLLCGRSPCRFLCWCGFRPVCVCVIGWSGSCGGACFISSSSSLDALSAAANVVLIVRDSEYTCGGWTADDDGFDVLLGRTLLVATVSLCRAVTCWTAREIGKTGGRRCRRNRRRGLLSLLRRNQVICFLYYVIVDR